MKRSPCWRSSAASVKPLTGIQRNPKNFSPNMRLFHYTKLPFLRQILATNVILPATQWVPRGEKPVVWFSFRPDWEPTASPTTIEGGQQVTLTFDEFVRLGLVPCRIEVSPERAPLNWRAWRKLSGVKSKNVKELEEAATGMGADVSDFRMTFDAVKSEDWLAVELYLNGVWTPLHPEDSPSERTPEVSADVPLSITPVPFESRKAPEPYVSGPKTGRNDPCTCGSGKKYKKCCGNGDCNATAKLSTVPAALRTVARSCCS
jgi:hypothetical protein